MVWTPGGGRDSVYVASTLAAVMHLVLRRNSDLMYAQGIMSSVFLTGKAVVDNELYLKTEKDILAAIFETVARMAIRTGWTWC